MSQDDNVVSLNNDAMVTAQYLADTEDDVWDLGECYWCERKVTNQNYGSSMTFVFGRFIVCLDCHEKGLQ